MTVTLAPHPANLHTTPRLGTHWRNKELGTEYTVLGYVLNCTVAQADQHMVVYTERLQLHCAAVNVFVREHSEFLEKFEAL